MQAKTFDKNALIFKDKKSFQMFFVRAESVDDL